MKNEDEESESPDEEYALDFVKLKCKRAGKKRRSTKFEMHAEFDIMVPAYNVSGKHG